MYELMNINEGFICINPSFEGFICINPSFQGFIQINARAFICIIYKTSH